MGLTRIIILDSKEIKIQITFFKQFFLSLYEKNMTINLVNVKTTTKKPYSA